MTPESPKSRLKLPFWRVPVDTEIEEELAGHIALQKHRYLKDGMRDDEADAAARARFGDAQQVREQCTDIRQHMETRVRRTEYLSELAQDISFAIRALRKSRVFALVTLATIAIGVGANTAIFSVIDAVLLQSPGYLHADRAVVIFNSYDQTGLSKTAVSAPEYYDFRETFKSLDAVAAFRPSPATITGTEADPRPLSAYVVSPNLFDVIGALPARGRTFQVGDGMPAGERTIILSDALWRERFGGDTTIIGKSITINAIPRIVVGIMPPGKRFPDDAVGYAKAPADVWIPSTFEQFQTPDDRGNQNLVVIGRKRVGATDADVKRDLAATANRFKTQFPDRYAGIEARNWHVVAFSLHDETVGAVRPVLLLFGGAVGLVLLIACVNVANLIIARGSLRQREFAVRLALGAGRNRLLRQLLTESVVLALCGGLLGVFIAWAGVQALIVLQPGDIPRLANATVNGTVLAFALLLSLVTGIVIGVFPALQQSRAQLSGVLQEGARGASDGRGRRRVRSVLVVAEVALALVLLNGAGLLARSFAGLQRVEPGFNTQNAMTMYVSIPRSKYDSATKIAAFYELLDERLRAIPGVTKVGSIYPLPMGGESWSGSFDIEGRSGQVADPPHAEYAASMPGYFAAMGIPIKEGRDFTADDRRGREAVVIVDELLAKKFWPNESAIGKRVSANTASGTFQTVVGVVGHARTARPDEQGGPQIYLSYLQRPQGMIYSLVRASGETARLSVPMREAVQSIDHDIPVSKMRSVDDIMRQVLAHNRFSLVMIGILAVVALVLASVGLYGVMSYLVAQRTREIGIRMALGGQPRGVRWLVVRESLGISIVGLAIGTGATLALSGAIKSMLFGITATDPATYASIAGLLLLVSLTAAFGPARRATRVAPLEALRG